MGVLSEEQRSCEHIFDDVTEERRSFLEKSELPSWVKALIEKGDYRWVNRSEKWRTLNYHKCGLCGVLRVFDQPKEEK